MKKAGMIAETRARLSHFPWCLWVMIALLVSYLLVLYNVAQMRSFIENEARRNAATRQEVLSIKSNMQQTIAGANDEYHPQNTRMGLDGTLLITMLLLVTTVGICKVLMGSRRHSAGRVTFPRGRFENDLGQNMRGQYNPPREPGFGGYE